MGEQVAGDAAAGDAGVEPPEARAALRQVARDRPVLQELGAVMKDPAEPPLVNEVLGQGDRRHATVIVPDHVGHTRLFHRGHHAGGFLGAAAERLLAHHHFAGFGGSDGDLGVGVVGRRDVDKVDVRPLDQPAPVGLVGLVAPLLREGRDLGGVARANRLQDGTKGKVEELADLAKGVRMRAAHEAVADDADVENLLRAHGRAPMPLTGASHVRRGL